MVEIVLGPPGCGKTTTLLSLVEQELDSGTPPDKIGFVTFTTKGAKEATERACKKFKMEASALPYFRTIHSLCYRALQVKNGDLLVGTAFFDFAKHADIDVTGRAWSDDGMLSRFKQGDRALFMENLSRIRQVSLRELYDVNPDGLNWSYLSRVSRALAEYKMDKGLIDYTDMLVQFVAEDRDLGLHKLFVDEAQDLSSLQWAVVDLLGRSCDRVVVAGDDDQAIYRWAGADVEHLISMDGASRVLGQSYRCPPVVQALSNEIISPVQNRRTKKWKAKQGESGVLEHAPNFGGVDVAKEGTVLVMARNSYILEQVEPVLKAEGIVYEIAGRSSIDVEQVRAAATWEDLRKGEPITLGDARRMYKFIAANTGVKRGFKTLKNYGDNDDEPVTMTDLIQTGGLLVDPSKIWHDALDKIPLADMSYMLAARRRGERLRSASPRVKLSTIHSAKGGEADHVVLMKEMATRTYAEMFLNPDDERRCWYVGVTRTRERLTVVGSQTEKGCPWL